MKIDCGILKAIDRVSKAIKRHKSRDRIKNIVIVIIILVLSFLSVFIWGEVFLFGVDKEARLLNTILE